MGWVGSTNFDCIEKINKNEKEDLMGRERAWTRQRRQRGSSGLAVSWRIPGLRQSANQLDSFENWGNGRIPFNIGNSVLQLGMVSLKSSQKDTRIRDRQPDWITGRQINEGLRELGAGFRQDALTKIPIRERTYLKRRLESCAIYRSSS